MKKLNNKSIINFLLLLLIYLPQISVFAEIDNSSKSELEVKPKDFNYMISGGHDYDHKNQFVKYMVSIRTRRPQAYFGDNHFCAGTIIGFNKILTAAHCVMDKRKVLRRPRHLLVVAGTPNRLRLTNTTRQVGVEKLVAHPNYLMKNIDDIAIIILSQDLPYYSDAIKVMPLPTRPPPYEMNCTIIGWGRLYKSGPLAAQVVIAQVFMLSSEDCNKMTQEVKKDHHMLCCLDRIDFNEDPCSGDNGGPLLCGGNLTGVISWTVGCGSKILPGLYSDVYRQLEWIRESRARHSLKCACLRKIFILSIFIIILS